MGNSMHSGPLIDIIPPITFGLLHSADKTVLNALVL